jgi:uncharacterized protein YbjT (DUF2867 family)
MILVAGGTGRLGTAVVSLLCQRGDRVRVLSRGLAQQTRPPDSRAELVHGDVRDPATVRRHMEGVTSVVSAVQGFAGPGGVTPDSVDRAGNACLFEAAERVGADVVMVSTLGAAPESPMDLMRAKYAAEQRLRSGSARWTIVRPEAYAETWIGLLEETAGGSHRPLVFGRGDNPIKWVSVTDVAALVDRAVVDASLRGRVLEICGPESLSLRELAEAVMTQHGWTGRPRSVPRAMLHLMANTIGRARPEMGRQARAALTMDELPLADDTAVRAELVDLPCTPVSQVLATPSRA